MMIFRVSLLLALAMFSLDTWAKYLGKWGLENVAISCPTTDRCTYNFRITRGIGTPDQFYRHTDCSFPIPGCPEHPASQTNFSNQVCSGSFDSFNISGQWYWRGYVNFLVVHEVSDTWAFFGYEASQVLNANASKMAVSDSYQIDTFNATDRPPGYPVGK